MAAQTSVTGAAMATFVQCLEALKLTARLKARKSDHTRMEEGSNSQDVAGEGLRHRSRPRQAVNELDEGRESPSSDAGNITPSSSVDSSPSEGSIVPM